MQSSLRSWSQWWLTAEGELCRACTCRHLKEQQQRHVAITPVLLVLPPSRRHHRMLAAQEVAEGALLLQVSSRQQLTSLHTHGPSWTLCSRPTSSISTQDSLDTLSA